MATAIPYFYYSYEDKETGTEQSLEREGKYSFPALSFSFPALRLALIKHRRKKKPALKKFECILLPI